MNDLEVKGLYRQVQQMKSELDSAIKQNKNCKCDCKCSKEEE